MPANNAEKGSPVGSATHHRALAHSISAASTIPMMHMRQANLHPMGRAHKVAWERVAVAALVTVLLSLSALTSPTLQDFFTPVQIAFVWLGYASELAIIALVLLGVFTVIDHALGREQPLRLVLIAIVLLAASVVLALLLHSYYAGSFDHPVTPLRVSADALRWGLPATFLAAIAEAQRRACQLDSAACAAELARAQSEQADIEQEIALLHAQIEPHFLFNTLGNVRRLYRTKPQAGAEAIGSLMRYLQSALPQLRKRQATLGCELELVRAYLELFRVRMGTELRYSIDCEQTLLMTGFPPTLLVTLAENAIKHGIEPVGGGCIEVRAEQCGESMEVSVLDDGAGFGSAPSSGTGFGLVNIRRQLAALYGGRGRLVLKARHPRGASATVAIPLQAVSAAASTRPLSEHSVTGSEKQFPTGSFWVAFSHWLRAHPDAATMAALLAFAGPLTFFVGALSVMSAPTGANVTRLGLWWLAYGAVLCGLLLIAGYVWPASARRLGRASRVLISLGTASAVAVGTNVLTAGRADIVIDQGLAASVATMHVHGFVISLTMAMFYLAYAQRRADHEQAAERLAVAQAAQRNARRRTVRSRLQELQARIDPQTLFRMLDTVRIRYQSEPSTAERFLDELISFLRAALPPMSDTSSSVMREVELARCFVSLHSLSGSLGPVAAFDTEADAARARFPPGVLVPLLNSAIEAGATAVRITAARVNDTVHLKIQLDAAPSKSALERVRALLTELYLSAAAVWCDARQRGIQIAMTVPYERI